MCKELWKFAANIFDWSDECPIDQVSYNIFKKCPFRIQKGEKMGMALHIWIVESFTPYKSMR